MVVRGKLEPQVQRLLAGAAQVAATQALPFFVVGAAARDMVLEHGFGVRSPRATTDVDLAIAVGDWQAYQRFFSAMASAGILKPVAGIAHKYELADSSLTVDIVPFGGVNLRILNLRGQARILVKSATSLPFQPFSSRKPHQCLFHGNLAGHKQGHLLYANSIWAAHKSVLYSIFPILELRILTMPPISKYH